MKSILNSAFMAFSMFSILPMPRVSWEKKNMGYLLACLPLVGVVIGLALGGWMALCRALDFGSLLLGAGLAVIPAVISGGIHLDGFCDTADALSSHALPERKREILKDSHAGAFAIIYGVCYFVLYVALCSEVKTTGPWIMVLAVHQVLARSLGAFASVTFPGSGQGGLLEAFRDGAKKRSAGILAVWSLLCLLLLADLSLAGAGVTLVLGLGALGYVYRMSKREFGGMSGDLAGFLITLLPPVLLLGQLIVERTMA